MCVCVCVEIWGDRETVRQRHGMSHFGPEFTLLTTTDQVPTRIIASSLSLHPQLVRT